MKISNMLIPYSIITGVNLLRASVDGSSAASTCPHSPTSSDGGLSYSNGSTSNGGRRRADGGSYPPELMDNFALNVHRFS